MYAEAIERAKKNLKKDEEITFGASSFKIANMLKNPKDLGRGYTSIGVFGFGAKKFAMIYFDANNMLPKFREGILKHVKEKYNIEYELYTTDTHSVNSLALPWSNVLGRFTKVDEMIKVLDIIIDDAIKNMSSVRSIYSRFVMKDFVVWGNDAEKLITKISKDIIRIVKHVVPFIIAAGFVIAAWLIYWI
jgi:predicted neutral ceramidase superfamily lipid hydrolase